MAKKIHKYITATEATNIVQEPVVGYLVSPFAIAQKNMSKAIVHTKSYTYKDFKKVAAKIDFTIAEWADLLCVSERTLQRYAKSNAAFNGLQVERILLLEKMIDAGNAMFGANLAIWLKKSSVHYNGASPYSQLQSYTGIQSVINYMGQLEWGIFA